MREEECRRVCVSGWPNRLEAWQAAGFNYGGPACPKTHDLDRVLFQTACSYWNVLKGSALTFFLTLDARLLTILAVSTLHGHPIDRTNGRSGCHFKQTRR
jgi:hypothetical protein